MATIRMQQTRQKLLAERARAERSLATTAERKLQRELNKGQWRFRRKKLWGAEIYDLWCSVLYLGVQVHVRTPPQDPEFKGQSTLILHFTQEEVLEEMSTVVQIIEQAALSQHAARRWKAKLEG